MTAYLTWIWRIVSSYWRRLPDFVIIGAQKGGTSSLYDYLCQSPDLCMSVAKEVHFFDLHYQNGTSWYRRFFPLRGQIKGRLLGEATPYYLFHPLVPKRMKALLPEAKLIVMLRNPVSRAYSHYQMEIKKKRETLSFEDAIDAEMKLINTESNKLNSDENYISHLHKDKSYLSRGIYYRQIEHWFQHYPKNRFIFIKSEDFFKNPKQETAKICAFLGINAFEFAESKIANKGIYNDKLNADTETKLKLFFKEYNERLYSLLDVNYGWD